MEENNVKAMREALEYLCNISDLDLKELEALGKRLEDTSTYGGGLVLKLVHGVRNGQKALAEPPRQCDVGTAEEQKERLINRCSQFNMSSDMHKLVREMGAAILKWAQMPYEEPDTDK